MTGFLALFNTTKKLDVAEGFWIEVKTSLTAADYAKAQHALLGKMKMSGGGDMTAEPDTIAYQQELVKLAIVSWNLTDEDGAPLPLGDESIARLPQSVFLDVYTFVNQAATPRTPQENQSFRDGDSGSDAGGQGPESDIAPVPD